MDKRIMALIVLIVIAVMAIGLTTTVLAAKGGRAKKACSDGSDNDGDSYIDWPDDPGCKNKQDDSELNPNVECDDGVDNDNDTAIDYNDGGCTGPTDDDETNCGDDVCEGGEVCDVCVADCGYCDSCGDTDGGNYPLTFGTTSGYLNGDSYSNDDYCVDSGNIMEYYCSGDYEQSQQQSCGTGGYVGSNYCLNDSVYRDWRDYFCSSGECDHTDTPMLIEECEWGCTNGTCDSPPNSCSDTDGGNVTTVFGTTSGYLNENNYSHDDYCVDSGNIMEYYCSGDYEQSQQQSCGTGGYVGSNYCLNDSVYRDWRDYFCSSGECDFTVTPELVEECDWGCTNGTCDSPPDSCSDTDGGIVVDVQGTVSGYDYGYPYNYTDFCNSTVYMIEYYCIGDQLDADFVDCSINYTTCSNGACV